MFERQVLREATIAKARSLWRVKQLKRPVGAWTMVYRSGW
jgi:hypothetical protein